MFPSASSQARNPVAARWGAAGRTEPRLGGSRWRPVGGLLLLVAALAAARAAPAPAEVSIQFGWLANVEYMGEFIAADAGYFEREGLHATLIPGGPSTSVPPLVESGRVLIGFESTDGIARARLHGARLKVVAATLQRNPTSVMSLASAPLRQPAQLVGRRIGVPQANRITFKGFLKANGLDPNQMTIVPVQNDPSPLVNGEVDGMVSFLTSQPIQLRLRGVDTVSLVMSDFHYSIWADVVVVNEATLADPARRGQVVRALRAMIRGWQDAVADPARGARLAVEVYGRSLNLDPAAQGLSAAALVPLVATPETKQNGLLSMSPAGMAANVAAIRSIGVETSVEDLFDPSLLAEAAGGPARR